MKERDDAWNTLTTPSIVMIHEQIDKLKFVSLQSNGLNIQNNYNSVSFYAWGWLCFNIGRKRVTKHEHSNRLSYFVDWDIDLFAGSASIVHIIRV